MEVRGSTTRFNPENGVNEKNILTLQKQYKINFDLNCGELCRGDLGLPFGSPGTVPSVMRIFRNAGTEV
jgi:hypothetical protein